jgi:large subunit ribosomal protein L35
VPKLKTKRGAAKRFKKTGSGAFKCGHSHLRNILTKNSSTGKRGLVGTTLVCAADVASGRQMLPHA